MTASTVKSLPNYDLIRKFQQRRIKQLNDFFIEVNLTIEGLLDLQAKILNLKGKQTYPVPAIRGGVREVLRNKSVVLNYLDKRISYSEYAQSLVFIVAIAEDYITDILFAVLMAYPKKILISAKGNEGDKSVDLKSILEKSTLDDILLDQARSRINEVLYAPPTQYSSYFEKVTGFSLGSQLTSYIELKATRDLLVHNDGYINEIYLGKTGENARGGIGEKIAIDKAYFEDSVRMLKSISSNIYRGLMDKYGKSAKFAESAQSYIDTD